MINEDLLDPKDREICKLKLEINRLKQVIEKFKEYDKERKEYYRNSLIELGELREFIESDNVTYKMQQKIKSYKAQITGMSRNISYMEAVKLGLNIDEVDSRKARIALLEKQISCLRKENERYFNELTQLRKALNDK